MHPFTMTMKRPQEALGIPRPLGRRLGDMGKVIWVTLLIGLTSAAVGVYIYQVNRTATKGFAVRDLEKRAERLHNEVAQLETQSVQLQSLPQLQERVKPLGYVSVDQREYIDVTRGYALAK